MLLPDNLLDTRMTAPSVLIIIFMISIHELPSDQSKGRPYMYTTVDAVSFKSLSLSAMFVFVCLFGVFVIQLSVEWLIP